MATSKLELHNVVKPCTNRGDYFRIYSNKVLPEGTQRVKFYGIGSKEPNTKVIEEYLENCGFTNISVTVRHTVDDHGKMIRALAIYAKPTGRLTMAEVPPHFFAQAEERKPAKLSPADVQKDYEEVFNAQRSLTKKECLKLKPGTWVELKWTDSPNTVVLLLERLENRRGDISFFYYDPDLGEVSRHAVHSQIVKVVGGLQVPDTDGAY